jgi:hypothetical protein
MVHRSLIPPILAVALAAGVVVSVVRSGPVTYGSFWESHRAIDSVTLCRLDSNPSHATGQTPIFRIGDTGYAIIQPLALLAKESHIELLRLMRDNHAHPSPVWSECLLSPGIGCIFYDRHQHEVGRMAVCLSCGDWQMGGETHAKTVSFWDLHSQVLTYFQGVLLDDDDIQRLKPFTKYQR